MEGWQHLLFFLLSSIHTFEEPFRVGASQPVTTSAESDNKGLRIIFLCIKYRSSPLVGTRDSLNDKWFRKDLSLESSVIVLLDARSL